MASPKAASRASLAVGMPGSFAGVAPTASSAVASALPAGLAAAFIDTAGRIDLDRVTTVFAVSKTQLAATLGVAPETLQRARRAGAPKTQMRLREMLEIVGRVATWAGGKDQALAWYRAEPIPAFGGRTAEALVKDGGAAAVRDYLDHVATGGFA